MANSKEETAAPAARPRPGARAKKRSAINEAARAVFAPEGSSRASIEVIAAEAGVSTRTIYNHFESKEQLFAAVLESSARQVADAFVQAAERNLAEQDPSADLLVIGLALTSSRARFPEHFAMVRQINAEAHHFPPPIIEAWQDAGPRRVELEVARRLEQMSERGWLRLTEPRRAAAHFIAITAADTTVSTLRHLPRPSRDEDLDRVTSAVDAFLNGYGTSPRRGTPQD
jgi:AcrR family transcriptional regulator